MTELSARVGRLVDYYRQVFEAHFRESPIINAALDVEGVGFRHVDEHEVGVLITPWFVNLVLLPGTQRWDGQAQGSVCTIELPGGKVDFTIGHDDTVGTMLSAALFSSVVDFPDQAMARDVAAETLRLLFSKEPANDGGDNRKLTRRQLFASLGEGSKS